MKNRAKASVPAQVGADLLFTAQQLLLPMIEGILQSRRELFSWVQQVGITALKELFERDAVELVGPRGLHRSERSHYRWGAAPIVLPFTGTFRMPFKLGELNRSILLRGQQLQPGGAPKPPAASPGGQQSK